MTHGRAEAEERWEADRLQRKADQMGITSEEVAAKEVHDLMMHTGAKYHREAAERGRFIRYYIQHQRREDAT